MIGHGQEAVVVLGRVPLAFRCEVLAPVERTLLNVAPADSGWNVSVKGLLLDQKPTRGAALDSANSHAFKRYVVTGLPTGVSLVMDGGETVLVSING